jgi:xanthine dehydrogenase accessory factor
MVSVASETLVIVRGGGDIATGVIFRLWRAGFPVLVLELGRPLAVRRAVSAASAVFEGELVVDGMPVSHYDGRSPEELAAIAQGLERIPLVVDPDGLLVAALAPAVLVDGRMAKANLGTGREQASLVIGLGPGFTAGVDCHAVVETNRGHDLGRVIWQGSAEADTGEPGRTAGIGSSRVLRAPTDGYVEPRYAIGDPVLEGSDIALIAGQPIVAHFSGVLRGLIHHTVPVHAGMKVGDLDPRGDARHAFSISEKSLAVGGGVLEAVLTFMNRGLPG